MADEQGIISMEARLWRNTAFVAALTFLFFMVYVALLDKTFTLAAWSKCVAGTSGLLFAYSLSLSTLGYYFDALDSKIIYRKYLGMMGYFFALLYCFILLIINPDRYLYGFFENFWSADFVFGLGAMVIFTIMAVISNNRLMELLGPIRWRNILRLGYLAFFLLVLRAMILEGDLWHTWLISGSGLPPVRLFLSFIALFVIFFRLSVAFSKWRKKTSL